ncbi:D-aminoacyl-tRNA deacylase [Zhihengliuella salsuginis]|uniref:D-aminoacyl-tRNA deacylase n=1 Tax=Zhihengliuella salsuginis TaxID=578222 RepID=A0ABQ3GKB0_9MICC|nr:D-aminoacyl-tRNA deacylase [Zhihengliuella salsuginis]GHD12120.1 D-aminoacyl-tRNA deacylase [Zhihengliuella salsuginis]
MKAIAQRVSGARVTVDGQTVGEIGTGLLVLAGVTHEDTEEDARKLAAKLWRLRMLDDEESCESASAPLLVVSQFTLYGDVRKGRRPSWSRASGRDHSEPMYEALVAGLRELGAHVETGRFGAMMDVASTNSGPFTLIVDTADLP